MHIKNTDSHYSAIVFIEICNMFSILRAFSYSLTFIRPPKNLLTYCWWNSATALALQLQLPAVKFLDNAQEHIFQRPRKRSSFSTCSLALILTSMSLTWTGTSLKNNQVCCRILLWLMWPWSTLLKVKPPNDPNSCGSCCTACNDYTKSSATTNTTSVDNAPQAPNVTLNTLDIPCINMIMHLLMPSFNHIDLCSDFVL